MRTRGEARRDEAAAAQHAALLAPVMNNRADKLRAALAAIGPPSSPALLAALAHDDHALLREACNQWRYSAVPQLLRAYGEAPDALACMAQALAAHDVPMYVLVQHDHSKATAALLGAYRRAGRAHEALAAGDHAALYRTAQFGTGSLEILRLLLDEYGAPGSAPVLAGLAAYGHGALREACNHANAHMAALLAAAYGPGRAALREALAEKDPIMNDCDSSTLEWLLIRVFYIGLSDPPHGAAYEATLAALLAALAEPDCATVVHEVGAWLMHPNSDESDTDEGFGVEVRYGPAQRLARMPPDSLLARLAAATPAAWALNPHAAHALLSAPVRSSLALPALLALRRLPGGVAAPVAAFLRARPWLLFSSAAATALAAAAAAPPPA
jgi:hypothetical protein